MTNFQPAIGEHVHKAVLRSVTNQLSYFSQDALQGFKIKLALLRRRPSIGDKILLEKNMANLVIVASSVCSLDT